MPRKIKTKNQQHACRLFLSENAQKDFFLTKGLGKIMMQLITWTWHTWHISLVVCPHIKKNVSPKTSIQLDKEACLYGCVLIVILLYSTAIMIPTGFSAMAEPFES